MRIENRQIIENRKTIYRVPSNHQLNSGLSGLRDKPTERHPAFPGHVISVIVKYMGYQYEGIIL